MFSHRLLVALSVATTLAYATSPPSPPLSSVREFCNLTVDVAVIGGGGGGAYAAARLHQQGYKVALIERDGRLGGEFLSFLFLFSVEEHSAKQKCTRSTLHRSCEYIPRS